MKYFMDSEFLEDGSTISLISIAFVADDGREYYAVNEDADWLRIWKDKWLMSNVVPHLPDNREWKPKAQIAEEVKAFLLADANLGRAPELWADFCAYDHVVLAQLWGKMIDLPTGIPMYTNELRQLIRTTGTKKLPVQPSGAHDALEDARHVKRIHDYITYS